jgi:hypothetical protein
MEENGFLMNWKVNTLWELHRAQDGRWFYTCCMLQTRFVLLWSTHLPADVGLLALGPLVWAGAQAVELLHSASVQTTAGTHAMFH